MRRFFLICFFLLSLTNLIIPGFSDFGVGVTPFLLISPILMFLFYYRIGDFIQLDRVGGGIVVILYMIIVAVFNLEEARWSSVFYSIVFIGVLGFFAKYSNLIDGVSFERISKLILISYFVNSIVAFLLYLVLGDFDTLSSIFQYTNEDGRVRFHGFSSEPSYASFIVCTSMLAYLKLTTDSARKRLFYLIASVVSVYLFGSVYGYLLLVVIVFLFLSKLRSEGYYSVARNIYITTPVLVVFYFLMFGGDLEDSRIVKIWQFLTTVGFSLDYFRGVDSSAFMRVGPLVEYVSSPEFYSFSGLFGNGPGASRYYFGSVFEDVIAAGHKGYDEGVINLGFIPAYLYDYGVFGVVLFWVFVGKVFVNRLISIYGFFFVLLIVNANLNTQLFCFVLFVFYYLNSNNPTGRIGR